MLRRTQNASSGKPRRLRDCRSAVAAMEFGFVAPIMAMLILGVFDLSKAGILWEQTWEAARSIAESASTMALQPDGSTSLSQLQAQQALSVIFAEMPWLRAGVATGPVGSVAPANTVSAVLTSVSYQPNVSGCTSSCTYIATVEWSKAYSGYNFITGSTVLRPCGTLTQVAPGTTAALTNVPTQNLQTALKTSNSNQPDPFLVADVKFTYTPAFFNFITGPITFKATAYWTTRSSAASTSSPWTTYGATQAQDPASATCS